ncbi:lanthionine synthetase C family protein [Actinokineospora iranica]|uniref:Lanthionine synthetase C-like protein n=1 Tax=Actinokineospora iranica TaxID=1271860 RepID=A0A1G6P2Z9_9PSEU|nr:lanthionine synthetase C family protein [Actinokineospora iranica]SDC73866.1 Lanthionine synthetase C-like protein [Actinokineospora iranica]
MTHTDPCSPPPEHEPKPGWHQSLSDGAAGLALLHITYAQTGVGDWATAHRWVTAMTRDPVAAHPDACLFHGAPAVAFVLRTAGQPSYAAALAAIDDHIAKLTRHRLDQAHDRIERGLLPELREFDLINGLTGIGAYLLQTDNTELLRDVLAYLVRLTEPLRVDGQTLPGWWTGNAPADRPDPRWPGGHANLGLAHGIAGPLALLATAVIHGVTVSDHAEAIDHFDAALGRWRCGTRTRPWWPGTITPAEWRTGDVAQPGPQRPSWCYGTPGLARARQLAGLALSNPQRQHRAETVLARSVSDEAQLALLHDDSLCHGWAGFVHTTARMAAAGPDSELAALLPGLRARWEQRRLGVSDRNGMLEGTAGIALTRHTPDVGKLPTTRWDACLLLAPADTSNHRTRKESDDQHDQH